MNGGDIESIETYLSVESSESYRSSIHFDYSDGEALIQVNGCWGYMGVSSDDACDASDRLVRILRHRESLYSKTLDDLEKAVRAKMPSSLYHYNIGEVIEYVNKYF